MLKILLRNVGCLSTGYSGLYRVIYSIYVTVNPSVSVREVKSFTIRFNPQDILTSRIRDYPQAGKIRYPE
jgi:hypothetical protein